MNRKPFGTSDLTKPGRRKKVLLERERSVKQKQQSEKSIRIFQNWAFAAQGSSNFLVKKGSSNLVK